MPKLLKEYLSVQELKHCIPAEKAKECTDSRNTSQALVPVYKEISQACFNGLYNVFYYGPLTQSDVDKLKRVGYRTRSGYDSNKKTTYYHIDWSNPKDEFKNFLEK